MQAAITPQQAARELLDRRRARIHLANYIRYTNPKYKESSFSNNVCAAMMQFILDVQAGRRPILVFQAPPQHGKTEIASRKLPPFILGNSPDWRVGLLSYADDWAKGIGQDVRRNMASVQHRVLFPQAVGKGKYDIDTSREFSVVGGEGSFICGGWGAGLTGRPLDIGIIDDPLKNAEESLSPTTKEGIWNWYQTVFLTRLSENSGQIIMATSWAEDDLAGRVMAQHAGDPRLTVLRFPAINAPDEAGYNPDLPPGALVPELHSLAKLKETKAGLSDYWWAAIYQQSPRAAGGNVFKHDGVQHYLPKDLPVKFDNIIASWDCTFKDTDGTDFVVGQVWGKKGADSYLLDQVRARMSFTRTKKEVKDLKDLHPGTRNILIEDKANGPAIIDVLKSEVFGILPVEPDGSKLARAHSVTNVWEAGNIHLPHPEFKPWVKELVNELLSFPAAPHDDQVDAMSQALRHLYPAFNTIVINPTALKQMASGHTGRR